MDMATVRFLGRLRGIAGADTLLLEAATVADALGMLAGRLGAAFTYALFPGGELDPAVEILVNGTPITAGAGLGTRLGPSDELTLRTG
jgi:molybdopterin converting factor small subunit